MKTLKPFKSLILIAGTLALCLLSACGENLPEDFEDNSLMTQSESHAFLDGEESKGFHKIYGTNAQTFETQAKNFLSFALPPNEFGNIVHTMENQLEGLFFKMSIELSPETQNVQHFSLSIQVIDSLVGNINPETSAPYRPFTFSMNNEINNGARFSLAGDYYVDRDSGIPVSGNLQLSFDDGVQSSVQFIGTVNNSIFSGEVRFKNHMHYANTLQHYQLGESGPLGSFEIPICNIFICDEN